MKQFPKPIPLPKEISKKRSERISDLVRSSFKGIAVRVIIAFIELIAVLLLGSAALFMDALATTIDIAISLFMVWSFKVASKPPDANHPFGHGRLEPLAGLQLGLFLFMLGMGMAIYQLLGVAHPQDKIINPYLWIVPFLATLFLEATYQYLKSVAQKQQSPALLADAWHYRVDSLTSLFATAALVMVAFFPQYSQVIDHLGAAIISIVMIFFGLAAARNNLNQLIDHVPNDEFFEKVKRAAMRVKGVLGTEKTRIQMYGPDAHVDIDIEVDPTLTVEKAHKISQQTRIEIQKEWPQVRDVTVHVEPFYQGDH